MRDVSLDRDDIHSLGGKGRPVCRSRSNLSEEVGVCEGVWVCVWV